MVIPKEIRSAVAQALALLPSGMTTDRALIQLYAIGLQESRFIYRKQIGGPARGFWQFEQGARASRGGVWGVFLHQSSAGKLNDVCNVLGVKFDPVAIYAAIETNDTLAAAVARLMLYTDPRPLPQIGDTSGAWDLYVRVWGPGKPHPTSWNECYATALAAVES